MTKYYDLIWLLRVYTGVISDFKLLDKFYFEQELAGFEFSFELCLYEINNDLVELQLFLVLIHYKICDI